MEMNDIEAEVYDFIVKYRSDHQISPSQREIAEGTYRSLGSVHRTVAILLKKGHLRIAPMQHRNLVPVHSD